MGLHKIWWILKKKQWVKQITMGFEQNMVGFVEQVKIGSY